MLTSREVQAAFDILGLRAASKPVIDSYCQEVADVKQGVVFQEEDLLSIISPVQGRKNVTSILSNNHCLVGEGLRIGFFNTSPENFLQAIYNPITDFIATIDFGYLNLVNGMVHFGLNARIADTIDPMQEQNRWVLGRIIYIGEKMEDYLNTHGYPKPIVVTRADSDQIIANWLSRFGNPRMR